MIEDVRLFEKIQLVLMPFIISLNSIMLGYKILGYAWAAVVIIKIIDLAIFISVWTRR